MCAVIVKKRPSDWIWEQGTRTTLKFQTRDVLGAFLLSYGWSVAKEAQGTSLVWQMTIQSTHWSMTLTFNVRKCNIEQFLQKEEILLRKICDHLHTCLQMLSSSLQLNFPNWFYPTYESLRPFSTSWQNARYRKPWKHWGEKKQTALLLKKKKRLRATLVWNANMLSAKKQDVLPDIERAHSKTFLSHPCFRYLPFPSWFCVVRLRYTWYHFNKRCPIFFPDWGLVKRTG